jgi:hypothetical protein
VHLVASTYPEWKAAVALVTCLRVGVALGYDGQRGASAIGANLPSALEHAEAVDAVTLTIVHIPGVDNVLADLLSRGQILEFLALSERHFRSPTIPLPIPIHGW